MIHIGPLQYFLFDIEGKSLQCKNKSRRKNKAIAPGEKK